MKVSSTGLKKRESSRSTSLCVDGQKKRRVASSRRVASESDGQIAAPAPVPAALIEEFVESNEDSTGSSSSTSSNDQKLNLLLGKCGISAKELGCEKCSHVFEKPLLLHAHLAFEHSSEIVLCSHCGRTSAYLQRNHVCTVCNKFFAHLAEHELTHFRDKTGRHALMECPKCYRSFTNVLELKQHCIQAHSPRSGRQFGCFGCSERFSSRHIRDHHFTTHIQSVVDNVMENIERIQEKMGSHLQNNQCPLCQYAMSSRKSFRSHLIYRHVLTDLTQMRSLLGPTPYNQNEMKLVKKVIQLGGAPHTLNGSFDCDEHGKPLDMKKRVRKPHPLPQLMIPGPVKMEIKEEGEDSGCNMSGSESPESKSSASDVSELQEPEIKIEAMEVDQPGSTANKPWVDLRNKLITKCLRQPSDEHNVNCSVCEKTFTRMADFEAHLISDHIKLALEV